MRTLLLLRHGKSDWAAGQEDHERPVAARGQRAARQIGLLLGRALTPDAVVCSTAERARATAELAAEAGGWAAPLTLEQRLYLCPAATILAIAAEAPDQAQRLLVVGHEPSLSGAIELLTGARVNFVTAALAKIALPIERWSSLEPGIGRLVFLIPPRFLDE